MAKYIIAVDNEGDYRVFDKKPTSDELKEFVDIFGYSIEEYTVYEVASEAKIKSTYTIVDKKEI